MRETDEVIQKRLTMMINYYGAVCHVFLFISGCMYSILNLVRIRFLFTDVYKLEKGYIFFLP